VLLTRALSHDALAELREDDLSGSASVNAALARFCLRQAQEGCCDEALKHLRVILQCVDRKRGAANKLFLASVSGSDALEGSEAFWAYVFRLIPFAERKGDGSLVQHLVRACAARVPCAATAAALARHPPDASVFDVQKAVAGGSGLSSLPYPLAFGYYAVLGFKETAIKELQQACRRLPKPLLFREAETLIRALGPLALEPSPLAGGVTPGAATLGGARTWVESIVESISLKLVGCGGFLEMEIAVLEHILQVAASIEPAAVVWQLQQQVEQVAGKVERECASKLSAERMGEMRAQFVAWLAALKRVYHTRPAVIADSMRQVCECLADLELYAIMLLAKLTPYAPGVGVCGGCSQ
jgi:hypothetical protein